MGQSNSNNYTREKTKKSKTNFYYSFLFLPKAKRDAIFTIYSFCRQTDDIVDNIESPDEARKELDLWRSELEACFAGNPQHPITEAMQEVIQQFNMPKEYFHSLIDGCEMDLVKKRYETFDELKEYCYRVASVVGLICIEIFGYTSPDTKQYAIDLGMALQLTNIMRDVGEDARIDRIYMPSEELERYKYSESDLLKETYNPAFVEFMKFHADRTQGYYNNAKKLYCRRDHHLLFPAEIMKNIYYSLYKKIVVADFNVYQERIRIPNSQKMSIALSLWLGSRISKVLPW
jgi:15-cis-phytoene synthase